MILRVKEVKSVTTWKRWLWGNFAKGTRANLAATDERFDWSCREKMPEGAEATSVSRSSEASPNCTVTAVAQVDTPVHLKGWTRSVKLAGLLSTTSISAEDKSSGVWIDLFCPHIVDEISSNICIEKHILNVQGVSLQLRTSDSQFSLLRKLQFSHF